MCFFFLVMFDLHRILFDIQRVAQKIKVQTLGLSSGLLTRLERDIYDTSTLNLGKEVLRMVGDPKMIGTF